MIDHSCLPEANGVRTVKDRSSSVEMQYKNTCDYPKLALSQSPVLQKNRAWLRHGYGDKQRGGSLRCCKMVTL